MASRYQKNRTADGYMMNYRRDKDALLGFMRKAALQFKVELLGIQPSIWRRFEVPADCNFWDLHVAIQDSMGWLDCHLHHFEIKAKGRAKAVKIGIPDFEGISEEEIFPGWEISVDTYFNDLGIEAEYLYDYGDSWRHRVRLEGYMAWDKGSKYPRCLDGARACPPEDCGGESGYEHLLEVLANTKHEEFKETREWVGRNWRPDRFDAEKVEFYDSYKRWKTAFLEK